MHKLLISVPLRLKLKEINCVGMSVRDKLCFLFFLSRELSKRVLMFLSVIVLKVGKSSSLRYDLD